MVKITKDFEKIIFEIALRVISYLKLWRKCYIYKVSKDVVKPKGN